MTLDELFELAQKSKERQQEVSAQILASTSENPIDKHNEPTNKTTEYTNVPTKAPIDEATTVTPNHTPTQGNEEAMTTHDTNIHVPTAEDNESNLDAAKPWSQMNTDELRRECKRLQISLVGVSRKVSAECCIKRLKRKRNQQHFS